MTFLWILCGLVALLSLFALWNWWQDEQERLGKVTRRHAPRSLGNVIPTVTSPATPLHPSVDPYLAELRAYLLQEPLPQGPGDMANRVYAHLNEWLNIHANDDVVYDDFEFHEVLVEETERETE
jgi:hypothetical protein